MLIIDSHLHVWSEDGERWGFDPARAQLLETRASAEFLLECMDAAGVTQAVIVQPITYRRDHRYVNWALQTWRDRFIGMALVIPREEDAPAALERLVNEHGYRAVRINPALLPDGVNLSSDVTDGILAKCAELNVAAGYLISPEHFDAVDALAARHPNVRMVVDHFGHCHTRETLRSAQGDTNANFEKLLAMARHPHLHVKLSEFPRASSQEYPYRDLHLWVRALLKAYGAQRLMWGTDFPFIIQQCGYTHGLKLLSVETPGISDGDMEWLLGRTAQGFFNV